jgi:hypothetical protein
VVSIETQRHQAAAVHCVDFGGVPQRASLARIHAQRGIPVQRIQVILLSLLVRDTKNENNQHTLAGKNVMFIYQNNVSIEHVKI